ncbi:MAG: H(+)-transporting V1 sector ATPase subunit H [Watsoniomyces obsoletus]|nr:MAG: H(+)-transporting V1 sector ATPase subunit H [Watsoniomyces obsoletus]
MSLDPPAYLLSLQNNIRARPIPWDGAVRAGQITETHLKRIRAADKVRKEQRRQTIEKDLDGYRELLLGGEENQERSVFEAASKRADVLQYMLVLTADWLDDVPSLVSTLLSDSNPYRVFVPFLSQSNNPEDPIPLLASCVLTRLLSAAATTSSKLSTPTEVALGKVYRYISELGDSSDSGFQDIAVQEYSSLLRNTRAREIFWEQREKTVKPLVAIVRAAAGADRNGNGEDTSTLWSGAASTTGRVTSESEIGGGVGLQLLYHVLLVLWQLNFEGGLVGEGLNEDHDIIALYTHLLRLSPKEKITRLLVSTLFNLLSTNRTTLLPIATMARLPSLLSNIRGRHLSDPDLLEDLTSLKDMLEEYTKTRTTFDEYAAEVRSGHLHWSPPHRNAIFWTENARKIIEYNQGELVKKLAEILGKNWEGDQQVLAVGCNDVACLVKEVPEMRGRLEKVGLKKRVMAIMASPKADESVKWESLRAVGEWLRYNFN